MADTPAQQNFDLSKPLHLDTPAIQQLIVDANGDKQSEVKSNAAQRYIVSTVLLNGYNLAHINTALAYQWIEEAAKMGDRISIAQYNLLRAQGAGYEGNAETGAKNLRGMTKWLAQQADAGHPQAQRILGTMYLEGYGVDKNTITASRYLEDAANNGDAQASYVLGMAAKTGNVTIGTSKTDAMAHFKKAADVGHANAQYQLARMMLKEPGQQEEAIALLDKAGEQGHALAQYYCGHWYAGIAIDGIQRPQPSDKHALYWYNKASEMGVPMAMLEMIRRYEIGTAAGVEKDSSPVYALYSDLLTRHGNTMTTLPIDDATRQTALMRLAELEKTANHSRLDNGKDRITFADKTSVIIDPPETELDAIVRAQSREQGKDHVQNMALALGIYMDMINGRAAWPEITTEGRTQIWKLQKALLKKATLGKSADGTKDIVTFPDGTIADLPPARDYKAEAAARKAAQATTARATPPDRPANDSQKPADRAKRHDHE